MNLLQAFKWNIGTFLLMIREMLKCRKHKSKSTDAGEGADQFVVAMKPP
jgi:hypothetical protein